MAAMVVAAMVVVAAIVSGALTTCGPSGRDSQDQANAGRAVVDSGTPRLASTPERHRRSRLGKPGDTPDTSRRSDKGLETRGGVVVTPNGEPVPGAFVAFGDLDQSDHTTVTGPAGRFSFEIRAPVAVVFAVAERGNAIWHGEARADGWPPDLTVTVRPPAPSDRVVLVRVVGHDGGEVHSATASPVHAEFWDRTGFYEEIRVAGGAFPVAERRWGSQDEPVFIVGDARSAAGVPLPYGSALVAVDPRGPPVTEVRLPPGSSISGRVVKPDGSPAERVNVYLRARPDGYDADHMENVDRRARTGGDGAFTFTGVREGRATLFTERDRHVGASHVSVEAGGPDVTIPLRRRVSVTVRVTDQSGAPLGTARVMVYATHGDPEVRGVLMGEGTKTDDSGMCVESGVPEKTPLTVSVWAPGFVGYRGDDLSQTGAEIPVVLQREGLIRGRVMAPDGTSLSHVPLFVRPNGTSYVTWDRTGDEFEVHDLPRGQRVTLALMDGHRVVAETEATAGDANVVVRWPDEEYLTLVLADERDTGHADWPGPVVLLSGGGPVASNDSAEPVVTFPSSHLPPTVDIQVGPIADGRYAFVREVKSRGVRVVALSPGERIAGRITLPGGMNPGFVECEVRAKSGFAASFETSIDGSFSFKGLPRGIYELSASGPDGRRAMATVSAPSEGIGVELVDE